MMHLSSAILFSCCCVIQGVISIFILNSFAPGRCSYYVIYIIFKDILVINIPSISCEISELDAIEPYG